MVQLGRYRHYCYGPRGLWIRTTAMFLEIVIVDGHFCPWAQFLAAP